MDDWARPDPDRPVEEARIEVPLAGEDADAAPGTDVDGRPAPNWRKITGISALAGIALGLVVATVMLTAGSDDDPPETTLDPDELADAITVPPTLDPVDPIGPDGSDVPDGGRGVAPLPTIADVDADALAAYDLDAALPTLDENAARRAHTRYVAGADGFVLDVVVVHDSLNDRYRIELDYGGDDRGEQVVVLDARGEWSYVGVDSVVGGDGDPDWLGVPNEQIVRDTGAVDVATLARSILLGPVRSDTNPSVIAAAGLASLDGTPVREFTVEVEAGAVPAWAPYVFSPSAEVPPPPAGDLLRFTVHVDGDARLRRVAGASAYGNTEQSIVHTVERLPRLEVIDLPTSFAFLDENGVMVTDSAQLVPEYEPVTLEPPPSGYDLAAALAMLTESPPRRATTEIVGSPVITAERDPDRGVATITMGGSADATFLVEKSSGRTFTRNEDGSYAEDRLVAGDAFVVALLHGVIEPGELTDAEPGGFVRRDDLTVRRYDTTVAPTALRSILFSSFGTGLDPAAPLPVRVFVDDASRVVELQVLSTGGVPGALVQRFDHDAEPTTVTLPADSD